MTTKTRAKLARIKQMFTGRKTVHDILATFNKTLDELRDQVAICNENYEAATKKAQEARRAQNHAMEEKDRAERVIDNIRKLVA